jgi:hypothetical protein
MGTPPLNLVAAFSPTVVAGSLMADAKKEQQHDQ